MKLYSAVLSVVFLAALAGSAQTPEFPVGQLEVSGLVIRADTGQPLPDAQVVIVSNGGIDGTGVRRTTRTNEKGEFSFASLAARSYRIYGLQNGYWRQENGQRTAFGPGTAINLTDRGFADIVLA
jgi:hypothetical protein